MHESQTTTDGLQTLLAPLAALVAWGVGTALLSERFGAPNLPADEPIEIFVLLQMVGGVIWLRALVVIRRRSNTRVLWLVLGVGLVLRLALFFSTPILENDYERYLWDGAVAAHGLDPYAHAPADLLADPSSPGPAWAGLVIEGRGVLERVNHPQLVTIYPPVAQGAFALAHRLAPWKPVGLRFVWLGLDLLVCLLLVAGIGRTAARAWCVAIYWLNPLLLKEVYNSLHMEMVLLACATAALVWATRRYILLASGALGLAIGAKLWPALWLPLLLRKRELRRRDVVLGGLTAGGVAAILVFPLVRSALGAAGEASGLGAYVRFWEMNDSAFVVLRALLGLASPVHASSAARATVGALLLVTLALQMRRPVADRQDLARRALVLVAALFLLGPTQFPWYFLWCLPALALHPSVPLLLLTVTLPLYYLRFRFEEWGLADAFDYGVVWIQFVPTWVLLAREQIRARRRLLVEAS